VSRFTPRATRVLTPTDGGKPAAASGQKSSNSRNSCSTSCCTQCHFDIEPFLGLTARAVFFCWLFASVVRTDARPPHCPLRHPAPPNGSHASRHSLDQAKPCGVTDVAFHKQRAQRCRMREIDPEAELQNFTPSVVAALPVTNGVIRCSAAKILTGLRKTLLNPRSGSWVIAVRAESADQHGMDTSLPVFSPHPAGEQPSVEE
jgi:hypothetical protein